MLVGEGSPGHAFLREPPRVTRERLRIRFERRQIPTRHLVIVNSLTARGSWVWMLRWLSSGGMARRRRIHLPNVGLCHAGLSAKLVLLVDGQDYRTGHTWTDFLW